MTRPRVLVAEDDPVVMTLLLSLLESLDCEPVGVRDGEAAWERVRQGPPLDLVLTDVAMPRVSGMALLVAVRQALPALPVVVMSGDYQNRGPALRAGASAFLLKPFGWAELEGILRRVPVRARERLGA